MVSVLEKFVTVRKSRGDVLTPVEYRTIVDMIKGFLKTHRFLELSDNYKKLLAHINASSDPHHNPAITYFEEIVQTTYSLYVNMTENPLSLAEFKEDIVPSVAFIELIRRITLNRKLYDQVRRFDGSVPKYGSAIFGRDWSKDQQIDSPKQLVFDPRVKTETEFLKAGLDEDAPIFGSIITATSLASSKRTLPVLFETSSLVPFWYVGFTREKAVDLKLLSKDVTLRFMVEGNPATKQSLVRLENTIDSLELFLYPDRILEILYNGVSVVTTEEPIGYDEVELSISNNGFYTLQASVNDEDSLYIGGFEFRTLTPFTKLSVATDAIEPFTNSFGFSYLSLLAGNSNAFEYVYIVDEDGNQVIDENGNWVIEIADRLSDYSEYLYILDSEGNYVTDIEGNLIYELAYHYKYRLTGSGRYTKTVTVELSSAYNALVDLSDQSYLEDSDGSLIVDIF